MHTDLSHLRVGDGWKVSEVIWGGHRWAEKTKNFTLKGQVEKEKS